MNLALYNFCHNTGQRVGPVKVSWGTDGTNGVKDGIVRRNVFVNGERYLLDLESPNGLILYNNVFAKTDALEFEDGMIWLESNGSADTCENNVFKNNIFYHNGNDASPSWWIDAFVFMDDDISEDYSDQEFDYNCYYKANGTNYIYQITKYIW